MNKADNPFIAQIDFDIPDEQLVLKAIFWGARSNELRGFSDAFSKEQIMKMWHSEASKHWSKRNLDWLVGAADDILGN
jgi:hypothetical protein